MLLEAPSVNLQQEGVQSAKQSVSVMLLQTGYNGCLTMPLNDATTSPVDYWGEGDKVQRELIPPSACVPNNRPEVVLTIMVCDHACKRMVKMERRTVNIIVMLTGTYDDERGSWY
jgi:hypothetical protein